jgi:large subunit ribosomal protein L33
LRLRCTISTLQEQTERATKKCARFETSNKTYMSQDRLIPLRNKESGEVYWTSKNKKKVERKIDLKKYSKKLRKRVAFKEAKK